MKHILIPVLLLLTACPADPKEDTDPGTDPGTDVATEYFATCDALTVDLGDQTPTGDCVLTQAIGGGTQLAIRADCTDSNITGNLDKRHVVMVPDTVTRDVLWLHMGGTGGQPTNTENIGEAAMMAGYRYISLAYTNNPSVAERCQCPDGPRVAECEGLVRYELLYGDDVTDLFVMEPDEAIVPRLVALLTSLDDRAPNVGWGDYLDANGEPIWADIAVSGFSQGGGMAGLIARDHVVDRAMYLSKGAGATLEAVIDPSTAQECTDDSECASEMCCPATDIQCDEPGDSAICLNLVPALYASEGADLDGDGIGDGDASDRATPGERQFAVIHRDESAYQNGPGIFASWGMNSAEVDVDSVVAPYAADAQIFTTAAPPRLDCSEHQSMGADACQARDGNGDPVVRPAWLHAMNASL
jgi:hypothetical protein